MNIILYVGALVVGFVLLVKGSDYFVDGAAGAATKLGIPQLVIGLTIVAMGTSAPEAAVSITAAVTGNADRQYCGKQYIKCTYNFRYSVSDCAYCSGKVHN